MKSQILRYILNLKSKIQNPSNPAFRGHASCSYCASRFLHRLPALPSTNSQTLPGKCTTQSKPPDDQTQSYAALAIQTAQWPSDSRYRKDVGPATNRS